ncbi:hypothetical protein PV08_11149 [Exophiala spinifera]|uniref:Asl1-like glycosyl hydrolase catalytic domain-containing protein n=1 Tax=Exophiala spinifera TaxID=91928 RepID=A0A0D2ATX1_9EURO|nr:uncharacterized protein PV08_11149 [Exophiala spinifera]KIW10188.1 hypothetical protein PV08_11149 [Exophiala spinifera]
MRDKARLPPPPPPPPKPKSLTGQRTNSQSQSQSSPSRKSKRGLGWPWDSAASQFKLYTPYYSTGRISWVFNWELWVPESIPPDIEWIPCVRTAANAKDIDAFLTDIIFGRGIKTEALLGFNEPEISDQANLSVGAAVDLWRNVLAAKTKFGLRIGSPGMSSDVSRSVPWLTDFLSRLNGDDGIDFLVVHWYGPRFEDFRTFLEHMHSTFKLPVWVNEFACSTMGNGEASQDEVMAFMDEALPWLDRCEWVERYAYYGHGQHKDVGSWVGRASNFTESAVEEPPSPPPPGTTSTTSTVVSDARRLSRVGRHYCEL